MHTSISRPQEYLTPAVAMLVVIGFAAVYPARAAKKDRDLYITPKSSHVRLAAGQGRFKLTVTNNDRKTRRVRVRSPHVARLDGFEGGYRDLKDHQSLQIRVDRLDFDLEPGQSQKLNIHLQQRGALLAGRYKLLFEFEDQADSKLLQFATVFLDVQPRIVVGAANVRARDVTGTQRYARATISFPVASNVRRLRVALVAGDLFARKRLPTESVLQLDDNQRIGIRARHARVVGGGDFAMLGKALDDRAHPLMGTAMQSTWVELEASPGAPLEDEVYFELRWVKPHRLLPAGRYDGEVQLLVSPVESNSILDHE